LSRDEFLALVAMLIASNECSVARQPAKNQERVPRIKRLLSGGCQPESLTDVYYVQCTAGWQPGEETIR
jgi:hypothetical protein